MPATSLTYPILETPIPWQAALSAELKDARIDGASQAALLERVGHVQQGVINSPYRNSRADGL